MPSIILLKNSFFYSKLVQAGGYTYNNVARWTRKMGDLLAVDKLLVPINYNDNHWVMIAKECNPTSSLLACRS